ncbi:hypothetical protein EVAR_84930_1 [Eumeta japonica]|uniref:Uncharacterized protein n=1 Tax=Eumeta variegata TaxID=151549 RepID=A0A4C1VH12_EUMVA|nr:hypothetical protein EVAR_84930_1 [Eumeta japonica]
MRRSPRGARAAARRASTTQLYIKTRPATAAGASDVTASNAEKIRIESRRRRRRTQRTTSSVGSDRCLTLIRLVKAAHRQSARRAPAAVLAVPRVGTYSPVTHPRI